jgi:hypothetical protein
VSNEVAITPEVVADMTVGEIELVEDKTGRPITHIFDEDAPKGTALRVLGYIIKRRESPDFTWEDSENLRVSLDAGEDNGTHPTSPARRARRGG